MAQTTGNLRSMALNNAINPSPLQSLSNNSSTPATASSSSQSGGNGSYGLGQQNASYAPGYTPPTPKAPIKKVVVNNNDGSSHEVHYDTSGEGKVAPAAKPVQPTQPANQQLTPTQLAGLHDSTGVSSTANNGQTDNSYAGLTGRAADSTNQNALLGGRAIDIGNNLGKQIADTQTAFGNLATGDLSGKGTEPVASGNAGLAYGNMTNRISALNNQAQQQLAGNSQAITAQNQTQNGLLGAAGLTAPILSSYGQNNYGIGGDTSGGGGGALNPINNVPSIAQQVISGQISPSQAYAMGGNVPNFQGLLNAAIQQSKPGFNAASAQGSYDAHQANTTTSGTTPVNAAASVYGQTYGDLLNIQNTTSNVDQFGNLLLSTMKDSNGNQINPTDAKFANSTIGEIRSQLSSSQQATFDTTFTQLKAQVAALLSSGGAQIPTQITNDANKIIDGTAPLKTIADTLTRIKAEGNILTNNIQNKLNTSGSVIGAPTSGKNNNPLGI